ncbi:heme/hemin ABC transporter substrate-binding protein [Microcella sp.]|uniref:heme/hemin ABC transporter substrate-binding protein n=1 Tax=Microcella sp. TaxID=1913979 RepID=UPI00299F7F15|nr:ABC transporter substrate-binding protein [Microcella sp.]MDX2026356.1 ABC transporter substrate-binding protein [Microcella sp.]
MTRQSSRSTRAPHRSAAMVSVGAVVIALLTGCSVSTPQSSAEPTAPVGPRVPLSELVVAENPRALTGPSTALIESSAIVPVATDPAQALPVTVVSRDLDGDRDVVVSDASRILPLDIAGSIAATVFALGFGDDVVGRDISTTFPEAADLPIVTSSGHAISSEAVLALRPTLVITDGTVGPTDVVLQLRDAGVTVVYVDAEPGLSAPAELARQVSAALGSPETGDLLAERLEQELADVLAAIESIRPDDPADRVRILFLYLRGASGIYYLFGEESGADELIEGLGGIDVAGEIGWVGLRPMTDEALVAANPDLILVMTGGLESVGGVDGLLAEKPAVGLTRAGETRRFVDMDDGEVLSFGPRTPAVLDALARAIYAP